MFIKNSFADEIARGMAERLDENLATSATSRENRLIKAAEHLNSVAEIFDELGLASYAEVVTLLLEKSASNEQKTHEVHNDPKREKVKEMASGQKVSEHNAADDSDNNCASCGSEINQAKDDDISDPEIADIMRQLRESGRSSDEFEDEDSSFEPMFDDNSELNQKIF